jgi:chromosome partitioning protein
MKKVEKARRWAWAATAAGVLLLVVSALFWDQTRSIVERYEQAFKLVGYVLGPFFAIVGFFWGLAEKGEMADQREAVGAAKQLAADERARADAAVADSQAKLERIEKLQLDLATIADSQRLWKLRKNDPFPEYRGWKYDPLGAKIVTIGLFKGGVGKTHLAANFAAYVNSKQQKPVLLIDLDYQGSLTTSILVAADFEARGSDVDALFEQSANWSTLSKQALHLTGLGPGAVLNRGQGLSQTWLIGADYTLTTVESQLLINRVIHNREGLDERYRLAHVLLHPDVRRQFGLIIIDTPPRMTMGTVNALVASHAVVMPTILDRVSSEAVKPFLIQIKALSNDLALDLRPAGIVAMMTRQAELTATERDIRVQIEATAREIFPPLHPDAEFASRGVV